MTTTRQVVLGVLVAVALFVALEFVPDGDLVIMIGGALLLLVALIRGTRLRLMFRVIITRARFTGHTSVVWLVARWSRG